MLNDYEKNLLKSDECPAAVDGHKLKPAGMTLAQILLGNRKVKEDIYFLKGMKGLVSSWETVQKLGIIPEDYPKQTNAVSDANGNRYCASQPCREPFKAKLPKQSNHQLQLRFLGNPRLQRICMRILPYQFYAGWIKGKDHDMADALSRAPLEGQ